MTQSAFVIVLALALTGCGSRDDERATATVGDAGIDSGLAAQDARVLRAICDGSEEVRFALRIVGSAPQRVPRMMTSLGISYLYVRGDCRYWVNPGVYHEWQETRAGTLTQAEARELSEAFDYAAWKDLAGYHLGNAAGPPAGLLQAFDGENVIDCDNSCISYDAPLGDSLDRFSEGFKLWSMRLWMSAAPSESRMRVSAQRFALSQPLNAMDLEVVLPWPFVWPIDDLLATPASGGLVVTDESRVRDLRMLRAKYVSKAPLPDGKPNPFLRVDSFGFYVGNDLQVQYEVWFRDALPFENDGGTVPSRTSGDS